MAEAQIEAMSPVDFKKYVKSRVWKAAFQHLEEIKASHSKVRDNLYLDLDKPQAYLTSALFHDICT
jgi:hypothetical protein